MTTDATFGPPVVHVLFAVLAVLTLVGGRMSVGRAVFMAAEAALLLVAVVVTVALEGDQVPLLVTFAGYLVALAGIFVWHSARLVTLKRALQG